MEKTAYILSNIGTPEAATAEAVGPYLTEFLTDPDVIPLPWLFRQLLVRAWIVPFRAPESAKKYALIWTPEGSPLMVNAKKLQQSLQKFLPGEVFLGMQYGSPSMASALAKAKDFDRVVFIPLFPQYAAATTGSSVKKIKRLAEEIGFQGRLEIFSSFATSDFFIKPLAKIIEQHRKNNQYILFTFHGLPESQVKKGAPGCLVEKDCCKRPAEFTKLCYRAQSYATANALAKLLSLSQDQWSVSFQSRLGRAKWIEPYTEDMLRELPKQGHRDILLVSPSFISDCLETLEELGVQGRELFLEAGGNQYDLVPCLNGDESFAKGLAETIPAK